MNYLELLKLGSPEAVVVVTALAVLTIGLTSKSSRWLCSVVAGLGLLASIATVMILPPRANLFGGMLVISPLNSLFTIICLTLAFAVVLLASSQTFSRNRGE